VVGSRVRSALVSAHELGGREHVAGAALASLLESPEVPDGAVPRLVQGIAPDGEPAIGLTIVCPTPIQPTRSSPSEGEWRSSSSRRRPNSLDDQQLDVEPDHERASFSLRRRPPNGGPPGGHAPTS
jgi:hypothetical protein